MAERRLPDPTRLRQLLLYDPIAGKLYWRARSAADFVGGKHPPERAAAIFNGLFSGTEALCTLSDNGYLKGRVEGVNVRAHRVIFAMVEGRWPNGEIDHVDGQRTNNRFENFREVTKVEQNRNLALPHNNRSGAIGVSWHKRAKKWRVRLNDRHIGFYADFDEAVAARKRAGAEHGYHPNHGRR